MLDQPETGVQPTTSVIAPTPSKRRRVRVFTVHGTFDHEAGWDNWDREDEKKKASNQDRLFVNRLRDHLQSRGIDFDEDDHTQYNWSGGNSHDERRTAAIGLKKKIQAELRGREHLYDGVYVIGHSHGGTISRLAMNLWDKDSKYYDPSEHEFRDDDHCPVCKNERNGTVGPNTVARPDRVFTFGSPFVTFEKRKGGLQAARIAMWVLRLLLTIPLIGFLIFQLIAADALRKPLADAMNGPLPSAQPLVAIALLLGFPAFLYWLLAVYTPRRFVLLVERRVGKGALLSGLSLAAKAFSIGGLVFLAVYIFAYLTGGWSRASAWYPGWLWWVFPIALYWLLAISVPGRVLGWIDSEVLKLREKLPLKYDPTEDHKVAYVSYHTPGDEAGMGLRTSGVLTWLIQTLAITSAYVLAVGLVLAVVAGLEMILIKAMDGRGLLSSIGLSPSSKLPDQQARFITMMDWLTAYPATVWSGLSFFMGTTADLKLGALENARAVAEYMPGAIVQSIMSLLFGLGPTIALVLLIAYVVNYQLRGSGMLFGSESYAWTLANRIAVTRRANKNTMLRKMVITPEAWWKREIAHCYYYKCDPVAEDVAKFIADPSLHQPDRPWPVERWVATTARWALLLLFVLSIFALAVPLAKSNAAKALAGAKGPNCAAEKYGVRIVVEGLPQDIRDAAWAAVYAKARPLWEAEVSTKYSPAMAKWESAQNSGYFCELLPGNDKVRICNVEALPCATAR